MRAFCWRGAGDGEEETVWGTFRGGEGGAVGVGTSGKEGWKSAIGGDNKPTRPAPASTSCSQKLHSDNRRPASSLISVCF